MRAAKSGTRRLSLNFFTAFEGEEQKTPVPRPVRVISVPGSARNNKKWIKWLT